MISLGVGKARLEVSPMGYGCMGLTAHYGEKPHEKDAIEVLRTAYDLGVRHFDTAQAYTRKDADGTVHYNEELVGKFLATLTPEEKKDVTVGTKFLRLQANGELSFDEQTYRDAAIESMKRLGVECIDLYYFHRMYPRDVVPVDRWMGAAKKLVEEGLIKRIGLSEASASIIREANDIYPITCIQQEWSLFARDLEKEIVPCCRELGIGIISYSPIGRGFLAGSFSKPGERPTDWRATVPYMSEENHERNLVVLGEFKKIAAEKGCSLGQLALSWVISQGAVPIPGTTKIKHLKDNMGAVNVTLSEEEIKYLGDLGNTVSGNRANESYMKYTFHAV